jgi:type IV pilus assembly protein PilO
MNLKPQTQREQVLAAIVVFSVLLAVLFYMQVYQPKAAELDTIETRVATLDSANARAKREMAKGSVDQIRARAAQYAASLELMRQLVPTSNEVPALLEQVSTAARRVNLDIGSVVPEPVLGGETFDTYRYRMTVKGGYHALAEFLSNVGSLTRIVAPVNLKLTPVQTQQQSVAKDAPAVLNSEFEIQTFVARAGPVTEERGGEIAQGVDR